MFSVWRSFAVFVGVVVAFFLQRVRSNILMRNQCMFAPSLSGSHPFAAVPVSCLDLRVPVGSGWVRRVQEKHGETMEKPELKYHEISTQTL